MGFSIAMAHVNLFSDAHHKFVCAEQNHTTVCNRGAAGPWESFKAECTGNGNYTFKSQHGRHDMVLLESLDQLQSLLDQSIRAVPTHSMTRMKTRTTTKTTMRTLKNMKQHSNLAYI